MADTEAHTDASTDRAAWYVRRGDSVRGPYPAAQITRYAILGRVLTTDEVSRDRVEWVPLSGYPELLPPPLRGEVDLAELRRLRQREDERSGFDRRGGAGGSGAGRQRGPERRRPEPSEVLERRRRRTTVWRSLGPSRPHTGWLWLPVAGVSAVVVWAAMLFGSGPERAGPRCDAPAGPQVNWENCRLERVSLGGADLSHAILRNARAREANLVSAHLRGANLAYSELTAARLAHADLAEAVLTGSDLKDADLSHASLRGADLSHANLTGARLVGTDLSGARLDRAVWLDGHRCLPGSRGSCRTE
jgi:hypothetical protein